MVCGLFSLCLVPAPAAAQSVKRPEPNWRLDLSREFLEAAVDKTTDRTDPVRDVILGTRISGTGRTAAVTGIELIRSDDDAAIDLVTRGRTATKTVGVNGKIRLYNTSSVPFEIRRRVWLNEEGVWTVPSVSRACAQSQLHGLSSSHMCLIRPFALKIATQRYYQSRGQAEAIASYRAERRLNARADAESQGPLVKANETFQEEMADLRRRKIPLKHLHFATDQDALHVHALLAAPGEALELTPLPPLKKRGFAAMRMHESAVNHTMTATVAGKTFDDKELATKIESLLAPLGKKSKPAPEEKEWTITFAKNKPVETVFAEQGAKVKVRLDAFTSGDNEYSGMDVSVAYKLQTKGNEIVAVRQGNIEAFPPDFKPGQKLSARQQVMRTILQKRFGRFFAPELVLGQVTPRRDLGRIEGLVPSGIESERGWLTVTLNRAGE
jgi:hypothetical protein